jgi:hypothetical protein
MGNDFTISHTRGKYRNFKTVKRLFDLENPNEAPVFTEFKTSVRKEA